MTHVVDAVMDACTESRLASDAAWEHDVAPALPWTQTPTLPFRLEQQKSGWPEVVKVAVH